MLHDSVSVHTCYANDLQTIHWKLCAWGALEAGIHPTGCASTAQVPDVPWRLETWTAARYGGPASPVPQAL